VTSLLIEQLDLPASAREARALDAAVDRIGEVLAGRTVWCVTALPVARRSAEALRAHLEGVGPDVEAAVLAVVADEQLRLIAARLDGMLAGRVAVAGLGAVDREACAEGARDGEALVGRGVRAGDVVVVHDPLSALVAEAVREHGARPVWHLRVAGPSNAAAARQALDFLGRFTSGLDAYMLGWQAAGSHGRPVERVAAAMPAAGIVATEEFPARVRDEGPRRLAWRMALAEAVRMGRDESVGGTLHPRPTVAAR
jgi:hypothetical protein